MKAPILLMDLCWTPGQKGSGRTQGGIDPANELAVFDAPLYRERLALPEGRECRGPLVVAEKPGIDHERP